MYVPKSPVTLRRNEVLVNRSNFEKIGTHPLPFTHRCSNHVRHQLYVLTNSTTRMEADIYFSGETQRREVRKVFSIKKR